MAERWDEAEAACEEARVARVAAFGEVSLPVVLSHNQLALIQVARQAPAAELLRGGTPDMVRDLGVFAGFAEHMAGNGMLAILAPMALQTAASSGDVLGAIDQLKGLLVGGDDDHDDDA